MTPLSSPSPFLQAFTDGSTGWLVLNRPERRNALSIKLKHALKDAWLNFKEDDDAWVAILWGGEGDSFCAGQDLQEWGKFVDSTDKKGKWPDRWSPLDLEIFKPVIAAVNGHAVAGGCWLTTTCHLAVAADTAKFGITEPRWNIGGGDQVVITRLIGLRHALAEKTQGRNRPGRGSGPIEGASPKKKSPDRGGIRPWMHRQNLDAAKTAAQCAENGGESMMITAKRV